MRSGLGHDEPVPPVVQRRQRHVQVDLPLSDGEDSAAVGEPAGERAGSPLGGEHERRAAQRGVVGVELPAGGDDGELGLRWLPAAAAQLSEGIRRSRVGVLSGPDRLGVGVQGAGAEEHDVGAGT